MADRCPFRWYCCVMTFNGSFLFGFPISPLTHSNLIFKTPVACITFISSTSATRMMIHCIKLLFVTTHGCVRDRFDHFPPGGHISFVFPFSASTPEGLTRIGSCMVMESCISIAAWVEHERLTDKIDTNWNKKPLLQTKRQWAQRNALECREVKQSKSRGMQRTRIIINKMLKLLPKTNHTKFVSIS